MGERGNLLVADSGAVSVWELMSPLGPTVGVTDAVGEAARALQAHGETVVMVDAAHRAVGTITEADLEAAARQDPAGWRHGRCEQLVRAEVGWVRPEDPVEGVVWAYRHGPIRPVLVFNGEQAVGIVHPSAVFQWCAAHLPSVLPALSQRAADQAGASQAPSPAPPRAGRAGPPQGSTWSLTARIAGRRREEPERTQTR
jgi:predicted transcriptional regulator